MKPNRWIQLALMVACTVMLGDMQYGWTLFVNPMHAETHWKIAAIQVAFTIMIFLNTWLAPFEGWVVDRYGPRLVVMLGGLAAALSWALDARAQSLPQLYAGAVAGGIALGCVFGTSMGTALKWFPDRRGLSTGLIAGGYSLGPAVLVIPMAHMIHSSGYRHAFLVFGLIQGLSVLVLGAFLAKPIVSAAGPVVTRHSNGAEFTPLQTIRTSVFWMIYLVYLLIGIGGMVMTAQLAPIGHDFGIATVFLALAVSLDNFSNGITRPLSGFLSDKIGRENAMLLMFSAEALAFVLMATFGRQPVAFLISAALIFLFWGEIFNVFPAICGDTFGVRHATANNGLLYTAKGTCSLAVPLASLLASATGGWTSVLLAGAASSLLAGILAKFVVVPMRRRLIAPVLTEVMR